MAILFQVKGYENWRKMLNLLRHHTKNRNIFYSFLAKNLHMKWTYSIQNKLTAAAVLFALCLLVLISNYNERVHNDEVKEMISTLYQDRLMAEEYLFELTNNLYKIREELNRKDADFSIKNSEINKNIAEIESVCKAYEKTKLTDNEAIKFNQFKQITSQLKGVNNENSVAKTQVTSEALTLLKALSSIQVEESKSVVKQSEQQYRFSKLSSELAFAIVIILLIVIQVLVFSSKTFHISNKNIHLN
jgi:Four helix bundle sensory module for signal transduction